MDYLVQVQRGIDYIEAHLGTDIATADVARHAGISQWHFQRIFKGLTNETLKTYIRSRRLSGAAEALRSGRGSIIDIALEAGFETRESFTRAFQKAFGVTPGSFRKDGSRFHFLRKARFDTEYLRHIHRSVSLAPVIYQQRELSLAGLHTRFYGVDSEKNNLARRLPKLWQKMLDRRHELTEVAGETGYGLIRQTPAQTDELDYFAVFEVSGLAALPAGMVRVRLPAAQYAKFTHRGLPANLDHTVNYIYSSWLMTSGCRHSYGTDLEVYGPEYIPGSAQSAIHYAIPVELP